MVSGYWTAPWGHHTRAWCQIQAVESSNHLCDALDMTGEVWSVDTGQHLGVITQELGVRSRQLHHPIISVRQVRFGQFPHRGTQGFVFTERWPGRFGGRVGERQRDRERQIHIDRLTYRDTDLLSMLDTTTHGIIYQ